MSLQPAKPASRYATIGARVLLGLVFFVFGLNGFLQFMPPPKDPMPEAATALMTGFMKSGYMMQLVSGTQVVCGALLLLNLFTPLALTVLAPVIVNIVAFHLFASTMGLPIALVVAALEIFLAWSYRSAFRSVLVAKAAIG